MFHQNQKGSRLLRKKLIVKVFCFVIAIICCLQLFQLHLIIIKRYQLHVPIGIHRFIGIFSTENERTISPKICPDSGIYLLIMTTSDISNFAQREVIRQTWGSITKTDESVKLVFVIGKRHNHTTQRNVMEESVMYSDILQINLIESYKNLTAKSVEILKWASTCKDAKYILKVDDDMFMNLPELINYLKTKSPTNSIIGTLNPNSTPFRDKSSKWYVSREQYPNKTYPPYISGTAYVISGDIIKNLYEATKLLPQISIEDVYITGMCRSAIKATPIGHFGFSYGSRTRRPCGTDFKNAISGHHYTVEEIKKIWREIQLNIQNCDT